MMSIFVVVHLNGLGVKKAKFKRKNDEYLIKVIDNINEENQQLVKF